MDNESGEHIPGRNTPLGFALRTGKNLEFVLAAGDDGEDVHVVTQVVLSLLGLVVFPHEASAKSGGHEWVFADDFTPVAFDEVWRVGVGPLDQHKSWEPPRSPLSTAELLFHLRNAIAHNNVCFSGDARSLEEVSIQFTNRQTRSKGRQVNRHWLMEISGIGLLAFCNARLAIPSSSF